MTGSAWVRERDKQLYKSKSTRFGLLTNIFKYILYALGAVIIAGLALGLPFLAFRWLAGLAFDFASLTFWKQIAIYLTSLVVLVFLVIRSPKIVAAWRSYWTSQGIRTLSVDPSAEARQSSVIDDGGSRSMGIDIDLSARKPVRWQYKVSAPRLSLKSWRLETNLNTWRLYGFETKTGPELTASLPSITERYKHLAERLPPEIQKELGDLAGQLGSKTIRFDLDIAPDLQGYCWEAVALLNARPKGVKKPSEIPLLPRRLIRTRSVLLLKDTFSPKYSPQLTVLSLVASAFSERSIRSGWLSYGKQGRLALNPILFAGQESASSLSFRITTEAADARARLAWTKLDLPALREPSFSARVHFLHAVGLVENVRGELRLFLEQEQEYGTQLAGGRTRGQKEESNRFSLSAFQLLARFPELPMCFLQGFPEDRGERIDSDRRDAALLRMFAAQLAGQGVAVLVIPPVKSAALQSVIASLAQAVVLAYQPDDPAFFKAIRQIQDELHRLNKNAWEPPLDVCLFLPMEFIRLGG